MVTDFATKTKELIDGLKGTCAGYGLGNDGNESKIITQVFLYKFMNDKFGYELKQLDKQFVDNWEKKISLLHENDFKKITAKLSPNTARLKREHLLSHLFNQQNKANFSKLFDSTLIDISQSNSSIFSVSTASNAKIVLFDELSQFVSDPSQRDDFCKALINQLVNFSFEDMFTQKFDFFSTIFEYLIKDYNKDGGGKYAEYYTPHAVSKIMAKILVDKPVTNVTVYDPSAGSGTLLMNVAHEIGENNCSIYSQDISQKSSGMLRLNLILNDLVHSIPNVIQGNTLLVPGHKDQNELKRFDYVVSNPPFKLDFSDFRDDLDKPENAERFFAGLPAIPAKKKDSMPIYLLFIQHILHSLSPTGKASIVVPTSFLTAESGIIFTIRKQLIEKGFLRGLVAMPSNIFATTGALVTVLFIDKSHSISDPIIFMDASKLGNTVKEGRSQKTVLSIDDENRIIEGFLNGKNIENFCHVVSTDRIRAKAYSFGPSHYAEVWDPKNIVSKIAKGFSDESFTKALDDLSSNWENRHILEKNILAAVREMGFIPKSNISLSHQSVEIGQSLFDLLINPRADEILEANEIIGNSLLPRLGKFFEGPKSETSLGTAPDGWTVKNLTEVGSFLNGLAAQNFPIEGNDPGLPVLKIAQLRDRSTIGADKCSSNVEHKYIIKNGDIVFSWSASLEIDYWTGGTAVLNQHLFKVEGLGVPDWFIYFAVRKYLPWFRMIASSKATTMGHIQRSHLEEALILVPTNEYIKIVDKIIRPFVEGHKALLEEATGLSIAREQI
jgi:type I restriction enzyme M protein